MAHSVMKTTLGLLFSLLLVGAASAAGTSESGHTSQQFEALDTNQDGVLSMEEAQQHEVLNDAWADVDSDQSNTIDPVEFSAFESNLEGDMQPTTPEEGAEKY